MLATERTGLAAEFVFTVNDVPLAAGLTVTLPAAAIRILSILFAPMLTGRFALVPKNTWVAAGPLVQNGVTLAVPVIPMTNPPVELFKLKSFTAAVPVLLFCRKLLTVVFWLKVPVNPLLKEGAALNVWIPVQVGTIDWSIA